LIIAGLTVLLSSLYLGYRISVSEKRLFSIGLIALFAGLFFESLKISGNWKSVLGIFTLSYLCSFISFLPGKHEYHYNFENHLEMWPYFIIVMFAGFFGFFYKEKVTTKLTEGITLLLSVSFLYWIIDYGFISYHNVFSFLLMGVGFLFTFFSIINAVTHLNLSSTNRLFLSIWSSIMTLVFAVDNIIRVLSNSGIENSGYLSNGLYIGIQYFLLGISAIYIIQNCMLLVAFLPRRNSNYKKELKENKKEHIKRYSHEQADIKHSIFCIVFTGLIYWLNYEYQTFPRNTMIWLVLFSFPLVLNSTKILNGLKNKFTQKFSS